MRKIIAAIFIFITLFSYGQGSSNPFSGSNEGFTSSSPKVEDTESKAEQYYDPNEQVAADDENPPNPGDPVPIDDYIPALLILGLGMIVYNTYRKKTLTQ